ncbi:glycosyltransferase family 2 protein [Caproiciproducens sp. R1]|uniref:glycosyltransferase family 2 protein n=1 Tax=Caproiciproducens sp. R1 TaxID=3435000 RepID=UPI004034F6A0
MEKILSISIAAYNVASTLCEALDPFLSSRVLDVLDIMIVDDGSKDNTAKIAQEYVEKYPESIRLIQQKNGGWGSTVNTGIQNAKGRYFRQMDGDDYYKPENMPNYIKALQKSDADMIITPYLTYDATNGNVISHENCNPGCEIEKTYLLSEVQSFTPFMHSVTVKTERIRNTVTITEHCFYTDTEFVLKACNQVRTVEFLDMEIYCYRCAAVGQSMSLSGMEKHYTEQTKVIDVLLSYMKEKVKDPAVRRIYDNLLCGTCCWQYLVMLYIKPTSRHKKDLMAFDEMIRARAPQYYDKIGIGVINKLRQTHFLGYSVAARYKKGKDNRFTKDGRLVF